MFERVKEMVGSVMVGAGFCWVIGAAGADEISPMTVIGILLLGIGALMIGGGSDD